MTVSPHGTVVSGQHSSGKADDSAEARLVAAVLRKDRKATAEFVQRYSDNVYGYLCRRLVPHTEVAEDLLQEVFLIALESLPRLRDPRALKAWLLGIARHRVEDHYRAVLSAPESLEEQGPDPLALHSDEPDYVKTLDKNQLLAKTHKVLKQLPEHYASVLLWRYWERKSALEMARKTGKTAKAIERTLARARREFKRRWNEEPNAF